MLPSIINTLIMTVMSLLIAVPFGIFSAIYLAEYAKKGNKLVRDRAADDRDTCPEFRLSYTACFGIPVFCDVSEMELFTVLAGALTLAIMILPLVMRTTEERF